MFSSKLIVLKSKQYSSGLDGSGSKVRPIVRFLLPLGGVKICLLLTVVVGQIISVVHWLVVGLVPDVLGGEIPVEAQQVSEGH